MLLSNKKVAIIGAGPVGLTMARLLKQQGIEVTVYERDKDAQTRISGGTLDLHPGSGQDALKKAGLLEQYYAMATAMGRTVADAQGKVLLSQKTTIAAQYDNPEINRNDLRKLLLASLVDNTVIWDRKFMSLSVDNGKWLLEFDHGIAETADLIIGANGGMSKARTFVTDATIEYTGTLILQGEIVQPAIDCPAFYKLCNDNILMAAHDGNLLVANPKNGGILSYSVIFEQPSTWGPEQESDLQHTNRMIAFLLDRYADWDECYQQLFHATASFVKWPTRKIPLDKPWKTDRPLPITLIGDAAHIMPPFAGQGVNTGLMDALILADSLTNGQHKTIEAAIKDYERKMFVYATKAQDDTSKNEQAMHQPNFSFLKFYQ